MTKREIVCAFLAIFIVFSTKCAEDAAYPRSENSYDPYLDDPDSLIRR